MHDPVARAQALFDQGYYCAESALLALAEYSGLDDRFHPGIATGFCSGLSRTSGMCGALSGAIMGLGLLSGRDRPAASPDPLYEKVNRLLTAFAARFGSTECSVLIGCDLSLPGGREFFKTHALRDRCRCYTGAAVEFALALLPDAGGEADDQA